MAAKTATAAFDVAARTSDRSHGAGCSLHPSLGGLLETYKGLRAQKTDSAGPAEYFDLSSDDGRPAGGERPAALQEPRPQERDRRHTGVGYEIVQNLEVPVPQMGEQLPDVLQFFAIFLPFIAEQVIEVPKIFLDTTLQRLGDHVRQSQMVEQLVHVPTVVSYSSLQQLTAEQVVDIPVPGGDGGGGRGGLQGFLPSQNSAALHVEQTVDIPVPGRARGEGGVEVFKVFLDRVQQPIHLTLVLLMALGKLFFALFPDGKEVRGWVRTRGRNWVRTLIHPR